MKKLKFLALIPTIAMTGCVTNTNGMSLSILCPTGAPSIAFYEHAKDSNFNTNNNVSNIVGMMNQGSAYDVVIVDTTSGIQAIQKGSPYKLACTITLGNFYIASTGKDEDGEINEGDTVVLFGNQNAIPYKIFSYLYGSKVNTEFCGGGVDKALQVLETGKNLSTGNDASWVFIAEPYLNRAQNNATSLIYNKNLPVINIQEKYKEINNNLPLMQASIFIKNTISKDEGNRFLSNLKTEIEKGIANPEVIKNGLDKIGDSNLADTVFGVSSTTAYEVMKTNRLGLGYLAAKENKEAIDSYIQLFGMEKTNEEIYF